MAIRVVLADDHYLVREGVRRLLETQLDVEVVAVCGTRDEVVACREPLTGSAHQVKA